MKKVKLSLNKTMIARLNSDEQGRIQGGEQPTTTGMGCIKWTEYPYCDVQTVNDVDTQCTGGDICWLDW